MLGTFLDVACFISTDLGSCCFCLCRGAVFYSIVVRSMALSGAKKDGRELKIYENTDELGTDLADYIAELSEASVKERGAFAIALSGGSLINLMGYNNIVSSCSANFYSSFSLYGLSILAVNSVRLLIVRLLIGPSGIYFGLMSAWWRRIMLIVIISWQRMVFCRG